MKTEMQVLERLKETMASQLNSHIETHDGFRPEDIDSGNVEIDFPDTDSMRKSTMLYIQPDDEDIEDMSMSSDLATMRATVFILCKGSSNADLIRKAFGYYSALYAMLRRNQTLGGFIEGARVESMDYYPAVTASRTMTAIEARLQMQWAKEF
jgi:hypothetical protein